MVKCERGVAGALAWGAVLPAVVLCGGCIEVEPRGSFHEESEVSRHAAGTIVVQTALEGRYEEVWVPPRASGPDAGMPDAGTGHAVLRNRADGVTVAEVWGTDLHGGVQRFDGDRFAALRPSAWDGRVVIPELKPGMYSVRLTRPFYEDLTVEGIQVEFARKTFVGPKELRPARVRVAGTFLLAATPANDSPLLYSMSGGVKVRLATLWGYCMLRPVMEAGGESEAGACVSAHSCPPACLREPGSPPEVCMADGSNKRDECLWPICRSPEALSGPDDTVRWAACKDPEVGGVGWEACRLGDMWVTETDSAGRFVLDDIPAGRPYHVIASKAGYGTVHLVVPCDTNPGQAWSNIDGIDEERRVLRPHEEFLSVNGGSWDYPASTPVPFVAIEVPEFSRDASKWAEFLRFSESDAFPDPKSSETDPAWAIAKPDRGHPLVPRPCEPGGVALPSALLLLNGEPEGLSPCLLFPLRKAPGEPYAWAAFNCRAEDRWRCVEEGRRYVYGTVRNRVGDDAWSYRGSVVFDRTRPWFDRLVVEEPDGTVTPLFTRKVPDNPEADCPPLGTPVKAWTQQQWVALKAWGADVHSAADHFALRVDDGCTEPVPREHDDGSLWPAWSLPPLVYPASRPLDLEANVARVRSVRLADAADNLSCGVCVELCRDSQKPAAPSVSVARPADCARDLRPVGDAYHTACTAVDVTVGGFQWGTGCGEGGDVERVVIKNELLGERELPYDSNTLRLPLLPGANSFTAQAWDRAGNPSGWRQPEVVVNFDNVRPSLTATIRTTVPATYPPDGGTLLIADKYHTNAATLEVNVTVDDDATVDITLGEQRPCGIRRLPPAGGQWTCNLPWGDARGPFDWNLDVAATDDAGNSSSVSLPIYADRDPPEHVEGRIDCGITKVRPNTVSVWIRVPEDGYLDLYTVAVAKGDEHLDVPMRALNNNHAHAIVFQDATDASTPCRSAKVRVFDQIWNTGGCIAGFCAHRCGGHLDPLCRSCDCSYQCCKANGTCGCPGALGGCEACP